MSGYRQAKSRIIATLKCAGEYSLAERIKKDDWTALRKSSQIYSECASKTLNIINYDIQTLQIGMALIPASKEDVKNILEKISKVSTDNEVKIGAIIDFVSDPTEENALFCAISVKKMIREGNEYSPLILECINFFCDEIEFKSTDKIINSLSSLNVSFCMDIAPTNVVIE
jgi:hypothetical protein